MDIIIIIITFIIIICGLSSRVFHSKVPRRFQFP